MSKMLLCYDNIVYVIGGAMNDLEDDMVAYLFNTLGLAATPDTATQLLRLPHYLASQYRLKPYRINGRLWMAVFLHKGVDVRPVAMRKELPLAAGEMAEGYFLVLQGAERYVRQRLAHEGVPFIIPGSQIFLPELGMELRPRASYTYSSRPITEAGTTNTHLSPAAQLIVLLALNQKLPECISVNQAAALTGYTPMTLSRAWNELETFRVGTLERKGKERQWSYPEGRYALWHKALPIMRNPILSRKRYPVDALQWGDPILAGTSALAAYSNLAEPRVPEYAITKDTQQLLRTQLSAPVDVEREKTCWLQVWRYAPNPLVNGREVDPFSLFLSLQDDADERVQLELEYMMGAINW